MRRPRLPLLPPLLLLPLLLSTLAVPAVSAQGDGRIYGLEVTDVRRSTAEDRVCNRPESVGSPLLKGQVSYRGMDFYKGEESAFLTGIKADYVGDVERPSATFTVFHVTFSAPPVDVEEMFADGYSTTRFLSGTTDGSPVFNGEWQMHGGLMLDGIPEAYEAYIVPLNVFRLEGDTESGTVYFEGCDSARSYEAYSEHTPEDWVSGLRFSVAETVSREALEEAVRDPAAAAQAGGLQNGWSVALPIGRGIWR